MERVEIERQIIKGFFDGDKYGWWKNGITLDHLYMNILNSKNFHASSNTLTKGSIEIISDLSWHAADSDDKTMWLYLKIKENEFKAMSWSLKSDKLNSDKDYYSLLPYGVMIGNALGKKVFNPRKFPKAWKLQTLTNFHSDSTIKGVTAKLIARYAKYPDDGFSYFFIKDGSRYSCFECVEQVAPIVVRQLEEYGITGIRAVEKPF
jgi:hypothetical protein